MTDHARRLSPHASWPRLDGRRVIVTGATAGLGFFASLGLARLGAEVVLASRDDAKAERAAAAIRAEVGGARLERVRVDTSSLDSVERAADAIASLGPIDALVNNAGLIAASWRRRESVDGHELTLATNTIGHFALATRILPRVRRDGRIVWLGSVGTDIFRPTLSDPQLRGGYSVKRAYTQSKLAGQVIALEWERRRRAVGHPVASVIAHPGYSISGRTRRVPGINEPSMLDRAVDAVQGLVVGAQSKETGARNEIAAVADPAVRGGDYLGPRWRMFGEPTLQPAYAPTYDLEAGARMWRNLVAWTGVEPRF